MSRRLPIYLVLDVSGSMQGEPIEAVKNGLQWLTLHLRQDPQALETAFLSMITFSDHAQQVVPLTDLENSQPAPVAAGGVAALGSALELLAECVERDVKWTTATEKGDMNPCIILFTSGKPTDSWQDGLVKLRKQRIGRFIACAIGRGARIEVLQQVAESVFRNGADPKGHSSEVVRLDCADPEVNEAFKRAISRLFQIDSA